MNPFTKNLLVALCAMGIYVAVKNIGDAVYALLVVWVTIPILQFLKWPAEFRIYPYLAGAAVFFTALALDSYTNAHFISMPKQDSPSYWVAGAVLVYFPVIATGYAMIKVGERRKKIEGTNKG